MTSYTPSPTSLVYMYLPNTHIASRSLGTTAEMCDSGMLSSERNTTLTELRLATTQSIAVISHGDILAGAG